jgi:uncharacterized protein (TIGR03118 family)
VDPRLVDPRGIACAPGGAFFVAVGSGAVATVIADGYVLGSLPVPGSASDVAYAGAGAFELERSPAEYLLAGEDGKVTACGAAETTVELDHSQVGAVYKGIAIAQTSDGPRVYLTNFHEGAVEVYDENFARVDEPGAFEDVLMPPGYAPFGIECIGEWVLVTYALADEARQNDVPGLGHGYVDAYDLGGRFRRRLVSRGPLDSPWGLALAPGSFGRFGDDLLVGNAGDGRIHAFAFGFEPSSLAAAVPTDERGDLLHHGAIEDERGYPIALDGLWALAFGNDGPAGAADTLYFTAGPQGGTGGLFGAIVAVP